MEWSREREHRIGVTTSSRGSRGCPVVSPHSWGGLQPVRPRDQRQGCDHGDSRDEDNDQPDIEPRDAVRSLVARAIRDHRRHRVEVRQDERATGTRRRTAALCQPEGSIRGIRADSFQHRRARPGDQLRHPEESSARQYRTSRLQPSHERSSSLLLTVHGLVLSRNHASACRYNTLSVPSHTD